MRYSAMRDELEKLAAGGLWHSGTEGTKHYLPYSHPEAKSLGEAMHAAPKVAPIAKTTFLRRVGRGIKNVSAVQKTVAGTKSVGRFIGKHGPGLARAGVTAGGLALGGAALGLGHMLGRYSEHQMGILPYHPQ